MGVLYHEQLVIVFVICSGSVSTAVAVTLRYNATMRGEKVKACYGEGVSTALVGRSSTTAK